jgi:hypothetical protein
MSAFSRGFDFGFINSMVNQMFGNMFGTNCGTSLSNGFGFGSIYSMPFSGTSFYNSVYPTNFSTIPTPSLSCFDFTTSGANIFSNPSFNINNPFSGFGFDSFNFSSNIYPQNINVFSRASSNSSSDSDTTTVSYDAKELKKKWDKKAPNAKVSQAFINKVVQISKRLDCDPNDLMSIMFIETGRTFDPNITNSIGAVGLIQFTKIARKELNVTAEQLKSMSAEEQLDYVEKYIANAKSRRNISGHLDSATLYTLIFMPSKANLAKNDTIASRGDSYYNQNKGLDVNKDGRITKGDLSAIVSQNRA